MVACADTCSHPEQLLWSPVQLAQRCRRQPQEQGALLYRRYLWLQPRVPSRARTAKPGVPLQP